VYLFSDAVYLLVASVLIFLCILAFTQSFFLTAATAISIVYSLGLAYAIYSVVLGIKFFPFMNILAAVIAIGELVIKFFICEKHTDLIYKSLSGSKTGSKNKQVGAPTGLVRHLMV
jgi:hypothetical protein